MVVEETGNVDLVISKKAIAEERKKLSELKNIQTEQKKLKGSEPGKKTKSGSDKDLDKKIKKLEKQIKEQEKKQKELEKKQQEQDAKIKKTLGDVGSFASGPKAFIEGAVSNVLQSTRAIPILGAATGLGFAIFKLIEKEFGDGGIFDLRKRVKDVVKSIISLENAINIDNGTVIFTADTRLNNLPPEISNTEFLRDGHVRFNQINLGN